MPNSEMFAMLANRKVSRDSQSTFHMTSMRSELRRSDTGGRSEGLGCSSLTRCRLPLRAVGVTPKSPQQSADLERSCPDTVVLGGAFGHGQAPFAREQAEVETVSAGGKIRLEQQLGRVDEHVVLMPKTERILPVQRLVIGVEAPLQSV